MDKGAQIEKDSFSLIEAGMKRRFDSLHLPVVKRVIHATGDFDFEDILRFHPEAITSGIAAIRAGKDIFADVKMVEAGINKKALAQFGGRVVCYISDEDVVARAAEDKALTRAECAVEKAFLMKNNEINIGIAAIGNAPTALARAECAVEKAFLMKNNEINIGIAAIGNAPTALARLMDIIEDGVVNPGLIVGVPVGFVKAEESKADLANKSYPYITCAGKKGGSPIAAAIINAIIKLAGKETP